MKNLILLALLLFSAVVAQSANDGPIYTCLPSNEGPYDTDINIQVVAGKKELLTDNNLPSKKPRRYKYSPADEEKVDGYTRFYSPPKEGKNDTVLFISEEILRGEDFGEIIFAKNWDDKYEDEDEDEEDIWECEKQDLPINPPPMPPIVDVPPPIQPVTPPVDPSAICGQLTGAQDSSTPIYNPKPPPITYQVSLKLKENGAKKTVPVTHIRATDPMTYVKSLHKIRGLDVSVSGGYFGGGVSYKFYTAYSDATPRGEPEAWFANDKMSDHNGRERPDACVVPENGNQVLEFVDCPTCIVFQ